MANGQWGGLKTVVSANEVSKKVDAECESYPRLTEAWSALEWLLARSGSTVGRAPNSGDQKQRLYVQADDALANVPAIWVIYRVGEQIEILAVNIVAPVSDQEEG
jgi:hypothetical protein